MPQSVIMQLRDQYKTSRNKILANSNASLSKDLMEKLSSDYFYKFEDNLHKYNQPDWLKYEEVAGIVKEAILFRDNKVYKLYAFTIMSNHVHLVIQPITLPPEAKRPIGRADTTYILGNIMESLKRYTAFKANQVLGRSGIFWQAESYDHIIRSYDELISKIEYTINNPVKAGLVDSPDKWKWNYWNLDLL